MGKGRAGSVDGCFGGWRRPCLEQREIHMEVPSVAMGRGEIVVCKESNSVGDEQYAEGVHHSKGDHAAGCLADLVGRDGR